MSDKGSIPYEHPKVLVIRLKGSHSGHEVLLRGLVQVLRSAYTADVNGPDMPSRDSGYVEAVFELLEALIPDEKQLEHGIKPEDPQ